MDYREHAKDLLSRKRSLLSAYSSIKSELTSLEEEKIACKAAMSRDADANGFNEERIINILADIDDCRFRRNVVERELSKIEKGMNGLDEYYKDLIESFFVDRASDNVEILMERWYKERSSLYRDRGKALEAFTRSVYGVVQI